MHLQQERANRFGVAVALRCISCVKLVYPKSACSLPSCSFAQQEAECLKLSGDSPATCGKDRGASPPENNHNVVGDGTF